MNLLADLSGQQLFMAVVYVLIAGVVFWLLTWLIAYVGIPEPFNKVAKVILGIAVVVFLINVLMGLAGHGFIHW